MRLSGGGAIPQNGGPLKVSISLNFIQTNGAAGSSGRNYSARVSATLV